MDSTTSYSVSLTCTTRCKFPDSKRLSNNKVGIDDADDDDEEAATLGEEGLDEEAENG